VRAKLAYLAYQLEVQDTSAKRENVKDLWLAKIGSEFEINNIQRGRLTCCMYEIQSSRSFG
jgi:hypothetical protein